MKHIREMINKLKENWVLIGLIIWLSLYTWSSARKIEIATEKMAIDISISRSMEQYESGKAIYMPGASCTIRASSEIDSKLFVNLAMACASRHEKYLNSLSKEN